MRRTSRVWSGTGHGRIELATLLNLSRSGQFPDDLAKIEDTQIHCVTYQTYDGTSNNRTKGDNIRGIVYLFIINR